MQKAGRLIDIRADMEVNVNVIIEKRDAITKELIEKHHIHNIVTSVGLNMIRDRLLGTGTYNSYPTHLAVGIGTTAEAAGDTALVSEQFRDAITQYNAIDTGIWQYRYYLSSDDANGNDLSEAGLFDASSGGNMLARVTFPADEKTSSEAWTFTWQFNLVRA